MPVRIMLLLGSAASCFHCVRHWASALVNSTCEAAGILPDTQASYLAMKSSQAGMPISCAAAKEGARAAAKITVPKVRCFIESFPFSGRETLTLQVARDNGLEISLLR